METFPARIGSAPVRRRQDGITGRIAAQVMRSKFRYACLGGGVANDLPQHARRHSITPDASILVDRSKDRAFRDAAGCLPFIDRRLHPRWDRHCTHVSGLPHQVGNHPAFLSQLYGVDTQGQQFASSQSASHQRGKNGVVPFTAERFPIRARQQSLALLWCQPIPDADSDPADSLYSSNSSSELRAEQTGVGSLKRDPSDGSQAEVDCRWCVLLLFEIDPVPQNYGAI